MKCPVCGTVTTEKNQNFCLNCAWEFEYYLDELDTNTKEDYLKRLDLQKKLYAKANSPKEQDDTYISKKIEENVNLSTSSTFMLWMIMPIFFFFTIDVNFVYGENSRIIRGLFDNVLNFKLLIPLAVYLGFKYGKRALWVIAIGSLSFLIPFELSQDMLRSYLGSSAEMINKIKFINIFNNYLFLLWLGYVGILLQKNRLSSNSIYLSMFFLFLFILPLRFSLTEGYTLRLAFGSFIYFILFFWGLTGKYTTKVVVSLLLGLHITGLLLHSLHIIPLHLGFTTIGYSYSGSLGKFLSIFSIYWVGKAFSSKEEKPVSYVKFTLLFLFLFTYLGIYIYPTELNRVLSLGSPNTYLYVAIALYLGLRYKKMGLYVASIWFALSFLLMAINHFDIRHFIINEIEDVTLVLLLPLGTQLFYIYFIYIGYRVSQSQWLKSFIN